MEWLQRARHQHVQAVEQLERLHRSRDDLDPNVAAAVEAWLWHARFTGFLVTGDVRWGDFGTLDRQAQDVFEYFTELDKLSYFQERVWLDFRDDLIVNFKGLFYQATGQNDKGRFDNALRILDGFAEFQQDPEGAQLLTIRALVHRNVAAIRDRQFGTQAAREDWRKVGNMFYEASTRSANFFELQKASAEAFDKAGDPRSVLRVANPHSITGVDRNLLLIGGKAQV